MATKKKVTKVETPESTDSKVTQKSIDDFKITPESKKRAKSKRIISFVLWALAIAAEGVAIWLLTKPPINMTYLIILVVVDLILVVIANVVWQQANRLDPAYKKDKAKFFVQSQLGAIMSVIAFAPFLIMALMNKDLDKKQKGLISIIAVIAMAIAVWTGIDFNPPSVEEYAEQTQHVEQLTGQNLVYWTKSGTKYHLFDDCYTINSTRTDEIFEGTVAQARELKNITDLCRICENRWVEEHPD
jgi:Signal transduction histidine kinase involved in nitrogen fixation and metabolism regulation